MHSSHSRSQAGSGSIAFVLGAVAIVLLLVYGPGPHGAEGVEPRRGAADRPGSARGQHRPVRVRQPRGHEHGHDRSPNYIPLEAPASGPNFYSFDDSVLYEIKVDNNGDGSEDIGYQFRFNDARRGTRTRSSTTRADHAR